MSTIHVPSIDYKLRKINAYWHLEWNEILNLWVLKTDEWETGYSDIYISNQTEEEAYQTARKLISTKFTGLKNKYDSSIEKWWKYW